MTERERFLRGFEKLLKLNKNKRKTKKSTKKEAEQLMADLGKISIEGPLPNNVLEFKKTK